MTAQHQQYIYFLNLGIEYQVGRCSHPKALLAKVREKNPSAEFTYLFPYPKGMATKIAAFLAKLTQADIKIWIKAGPKTCHGYCDLVLKLPPLTACMKEYEEFRKEVNQDV
jgi:hypothetical protein